MLYSLAATCDAAGVEPFAYLRDVIERVDGVEPSALTPAAWAASRAEPQRRQRRLRRGSSSTHVTTGQVPSIERLSRGEGFAYYSQRELNPDERRTDSFVHLRVYDSVISERKFYFAWEDTFNTANNDFTDLVTSVSGVECAGAGAECATGGIGACAVGVTRCTKGTLECVPRYEGEPERCDGLDNNCDGLVDETHDCPADEVCSNGACVPHYDIGSEFQCGLVRDRCDPATGVCLEPACVDVTCPEGDVCRDGECRGECDGMVCPGGMLSFLDQCIDPCRDIACGGGMICRGGLCVPGSNQCDGLTCAVDEVCDGDTSDCHHPACPSERPRGMFCDGATGCRDACEGAVCPRGEVCRMALPREETPAAVARALDRRTEERLPLQ